MITGGCHEDDEHDYDDCLSLCVSLCERTDNSIGQQEI